MLRNRRGATSLRWRGALLDAGIEVHGQVVVCPGLNDGAVLDDTLAGVFDRFPALASLCVVPLGVSRYNTEARMRPHTQPEAAAVVDCVEDWQDVYRHVLGRRLVFLGDEYYLLAERPFPEAEVYEGFSMHEDGVGMARTLEMELFGTKPDATGTHDGFFSWVDGSGSVDAEYEPYRGPRATAGQLLHLRPSRHAPVGILSSTYGARVLAPLVARLGRDDVRVVPVDNQFFGGTTGVTGLLVGEDLARELRHQPEGHRYLLPDVCLSNGRFLDGTAPEDLPRPVEVIATDGHALRRALGLDLPAMESA
jgi:NifB/MoaA-like Fe-S oxidoreductase